MIKSVEKVQEYRCGNKVYGVYKAIISDREADVIIARNGNEYRTLTHYDDRDELDEVTYAFISEFSNVLAGVKP